MASTPPIAAKDLPQYVGKSVTVIGWLVTEKIVSTKNGEPMEFLILEDQTALYDATVFPATYRRYCQLLATNHAYAVTGRVERQFSIVALTVTDLKLLACRAGGVQYELIEDALQEPYA